MNQKKSWKKPEDEAQAPDPQTLERIAVGLLARREHSRAELHHKLTIRRFSAEDVERLLDRLAVQKLQSDDRFAAAYVRMRCNRGYGPQRIRVELRERGITAELIEQTFAAQSDTDTPSIDAIWDRKFAGHLPENYRERARQMRFLQQRGFPIADIYALFGRLGARDNE